MRYLPLTPEDRRKMLDTIGVSEVDDLFSDIPESARLPHGLNTLPGHASELAVERHMRGLAHKNLNAKDVPSFCGAGAYRHHVPASVDHLIQRSEYLTAYTPYQPEIAQGTLQTMFEFQSQVAQITGMDVANASLYDGSTATTESVLMAARVTRRGKCVIAPGLHPHYAQAVRTMTHTKGVTTAEAEPGLGNDAEALALLDQETACIVVQSPNVFGEVIDLASYASAAHAVGALLVAVTTEAVSYGLLPSPGSMGADIVAAEGQSIGNGLNFGGPYVGLFACRNDRKFIRQAPGRFTGETVDANGDRGYVLTLSTREQHIRRDKATSNICTNSGLCSLAFSMHLALLGERGFEHLARLNHEKACQLADMLVKLPGVEVINSGYFNEFTIRLPRNAEAVVEDLTKWKVLGGVPASRLFGKGHFEDLLIVAVTELITDEDMKVFCKALAEVL